MYWTELNCIRSVFEVRIANLNLVIKRFDLLLGAVTCGLCKTTKSKLRCMNYLLHLNPRIIHQKSAKLVLKNPRNDMMWCAELNLYVGLVGAGIVLLPFFFISFLFKVNIFVCVINFFWVEALTSLVICLTENHACHIAFSNVFDSCISRV